MKATWWYLNGTPLAEFKGLPRKTKDRLKHVVTVLGVHVFVDPQMSERYGSLELRDRYGVLLAVIKGGGKP